MMVNDTYSDIISNAGSIYKYTIYLHNPHFTAPVRSPVRTLRFSPQNNATTKFYIARADSAPPTTPHAPMSLTDSAGPGVAARRRGSNSCEINIHKQVRQQDTNPPYGGCTPPWRRGGAQGLTFLESSRRADVKL